MGLCGNFTRVSHTVKEISNSYHFLVMYIIFTNLYEGTDEFFPLGTATQLEQTLFCLYFFLLLLLYLVRTSCTRALES